MASVSFAYPQDQLIALAPRTPRPRQRRRSPPASTSTRSTSAIAIEGDNPAWRPLRAFDDGRQVFIEFPSGIAQGEMPPLWVIGAEGEGQLVNYRVRGNYMIVDRLFAAAELGSAAIRSRSCASSAPMEGRES